MAQKSMMTMATNKGPIIGAAKRAYFAMAKKLKIDSPELKAFAEERAFKRKRARLKETAAKEVAEIQHEARKHTAHILEEMIKIATSGTAVESARIQAAHFVYDRAYGKAPQTQTNVNVNSDGKPSQITGSALARRIDEALKRIEAVTGGGTTAPAGEERPADIRKCDIDPDSGTRH